MRVLIVNTSERKGGAAVAARRLTEALINSGVKARMLVMEKQSDALFVSDCGSRWAQQFHFLWERLVIWVCNLFSRRHLFKVSIANAGSDITQTAEFREADIIHLHWINQGFLSLRSLQLILQSGKPVVWTMHDMWPLTSICHHAYQCERYREACGRCPFLRFPGRHDLSSRVFRRKQRLLDGHRVTFVAVSRWLADRARQSALIGRQPIFCVPNSISLSRFVMSDRAEARRALGIGEPYVLVFGAARIDDDIKGLGYLLDALRLLIDRGAFRSADVLLLLFGGVRDERVLHRVPVASRYLGYVKDEKRLSQIYSASNCVVSSSLYETFGQTLIEAQACGSLPVSFGNSGQADIITHRQNGYLADYLSAESLAEGIEWALRADVDRAGLRATVQRRFSEAVVARQYINIYQSLLPSRPSQQP